MCPDTPGQDHPSPDAPSDHHNVEDDADRPLVAESASDTDSAIGISDDQLSTDSLRSSIYNYEQENGRLYHALSRGSKFAF